MTSLHRGTKQQLCVPVECEGIPHLWEVSASVHDLVTYPLILSLTHSPVYT